MRRYLPILPLPVIPKRPLVPPPPVTRPTVPLLITTPPQAPRRPIPLIAPTPLEAAPRRPMPPLAPTPTRRPLVPLAPPSGRHPTDRPLAAPGLISYRYPGAYGWIMIGARDDADALNEARRSTNDTVSPNRLEKWNGTHYTVATPSPSLRRAPVVVPAKAPRLPLGLWPFRVFGRHPVSGEVIAIQHGIRGYFQIGNHINPVERNRQSGVPEEVAQAVIVTAFQETEDGGTVWAGSSTIDWNATE